jgi:UDP-N-acetylmuramyl pentapeptide phosphotransferase/UDP-N-acetylglucosamine-1-phosphate transferase
MIDFFNHFTALLNQNFIYLTLGLLMSNMVIIFIWDKKFIKEFFHIPYDGAQRVHMGEVSRLGGALIYLWFFLALIIQINNQTEEIFSHYIKFLIIIFPLIFMSIIEDTHSNVSVKLRFSVMVITMLILCSSWISSFPIVEHIPFLSYLTENRYFSIIFYSISLVALINGSNFIDGMNGLLGFFAAGAILSCIYISNEIGSQKDISVLILLLIALIVFFLFNFPFGKIFLGDTGAYFLGLFLGVWLIEFFSANDNLSSWNAVLILFYPMIEVIYSFLRKVFQKKSPFYPDRFHLHLKIFRVLNNLFHRPTLANSITTLVLSIFWLAPPLLIPFVMYSQVKIILSISILTTIYLIINYYTRYDN